MLGVILFMVLNKLALIPTVIFERISRNSKYVTSVIPELLFHSL